MPIFEERESLVVKTLGHYKRVGKYGKSIISSLMDLNYKFIESHFSRKDSYEFVVYHGKGGASAALQATFQVSI